MHSDMPTRNRLKWSCAMTSGSFNWSQERTARRNQAWRALIAPPTRFEQEPSTPLGLIDPVLDQAGSRDIAVFVDHPMQLPQARRQGLVVIAQLSEHVERFNVVGVVIHDPLDA